MLATYISGSCLSCHGIIHLLTIIFKPEKVAKVDYSVVLSYKFQFKIGFMTFLWTTANYLTNVAFEDSYIPAVVTVLQTSSVVALLLTWIFEGKRPSLINFTGCMLVLEGIFGFAYVKLQLEKDEDNKFGIGLIAALISAIIFPCYNYMQETTPELKDITSKIILLNISLYVLCFGWIPVLVLHLIGYESLTKLPGFVLLKLFGNGLSSMICEYLLIYAVRRTSTFLMTVLMSLGSPLAYIEDVIINTIKKRKTKWSIWYLPIFAHVVIGCIYSAINSKIKKVDDAAKTSELDTNDITHVVTMETTKNKSTTTIQ